MNVRLLLTTLVFVAAGASDARSQAAGKFPPDSLVNVRIIPRNTPPIEVIGMMRNFSSYLGVRCQYCHVGTEGQPLERFDFASDEKRAKVVARQMMQMLAEINRRVDSVPGKSGPAVPVTCNTCHRGVSRPIPLANIIAEAAQSNGADSATRVYRQLRQQYFGRDAYDFSELTLNSAALRVARAGKIVDAIALLDLNEQHFPNAAMMYVFRGNIQLIKGDTAAAERAFREALRRQPNNFDAASRLRAIGRPPQ